ncbi:hypothetical protein FRE64_10895 [Euhalothece natronophila Z-M001]|uniref:Uncharacterized protein n=1 Tax=Euhalothece natronophila Z-M001 TaxID=522448 RepID=A0A5B8NN13_9CHRO|nr:hypothetical protein [Euhalothece natronophila]QDZ40418.1 hypothetical protein FRE64_10895 [Euhalothece natronophila Z-M001]
MKTIIVVPIQFRSAAILAATREQDAPTTFRLLFFIWNHYNLAELATGFRHTAQPSSNYKRLQRFFKNYKLDYCLLAKAIVTLMEFPQP